MGVAREPLQTYRPHLCSFLQEVRAGATLTVTAGVLWAGLVSRGPGILLGLPLIAVGASGAAILREEAAGVGQGILQTRRGQLPRFPAVMEAALLAAAVAWVVAAVVARVDIW